jgi:Ni2+-binding GTPase involved in maturation of urease and hydrogenase
MSGSLNVPVFGNTAGENAIQINGPFVFRKDLNLIWKQYDARLTVFCQKWKEKPS